MNRVMSTQEAWNNGDYRADDATKPLGELAEPSRHEPRTELREFPLLRSGIPADIFLFDRGTDRLVLPRRRAVS
jgi:hypothetical protein